MNALTKVFHRAKVFLPVIHPTSKVIALTSIQTAVESGADGIFLINQGMNAEELLAFVPEIHCRYEKLWIGINLLGWFPHEVVDMVRDLPIGGIWSDNAGIDERRTEQPAGEQFAAARKANAWDGVYFGGVAFKYQREVAEDAISLAAEKAATWMDVITSSGPGTGHAATVDKAKALRDGAGDHPVALASGISPDNVDGFLPYVDAFLVASEIETEKYSGVLVPERTKMLADKIHRWEGDQRS